MASTSDQEATRVAVAPTKDDIKPPADETPADVPVVSAEPASEANSESDKKDTEEEKPAEENKEEEKEKILVGAVSEIKELYAKYDKDGNRSWSEEVPDDLVEAAENEKSLKYAVLVRKKKPKEADSTKPLVIDSLIIQSPHLKKVLCTVMKDYPGIVPNVSRLVFYAPFECFVHRWDEFTAELASPDHDELTREHLNLLHGILQEELGHIITLRQDYFKNKAVTFDHLWALFVPGDTILTVKHGKPIAVRFKRGFFGMTQCGRAFQMESEYIDWDGLTLGWVSTKLMVLEFVGAKPFTELSAYPIQFHEQPDVVRAVLEMRGRKFESLCGYHYKAYEGVAFYHPEMDPSKTSSESVATRIVIDAASWEKANPDHQVYPRTLNDGEDAGYRSRRGSISSDSEDYFSDAGSESNEAVAVPRLKDDQVLLTAATLRGYSLRTRRWMEFFVDLVKEVEFDDNAFDSLVLDKDHKELILAFAQSQVQFKDSFDDIISGKGKGIIMLLSGGPGIGKTLTAESVAEEMHAPLYVMGAGDLGTQPHELERNLGEVLTMVSNWNAVLLLDECDIFLEARSSTDMHRNRIVGIFLRMLEYYEGILFLTTNRVRDMDPAFESRIHMSLEYPDLDCNSRATVWRTFLARAVNPDKKFFGQAVYDVSDKDVVRLSNLNLNGRQIKNAIKMANLLSCQQGEKLTFTHIQKVLRAQGHSL